MSKLTNPRELREFTDITSHNNKIYLNPSNTLVTSRYSKLSGVSTGTAQDIAEETSRNKINETKTIKDKVGSVSSKGNFTLP